MPLVKVGSKHQVVIPKSVFDKLGLAPGDYVEITAQKGKAVMKRKKVVDDFPETDEPLHPKTLASLRQGLKDAAEGRVSGPFRTAKELQDHLDSLKNRR